ncbi:phosphatase PAP2 family protein [Candidatus Woesearchaeota archaeon]|nr:phosphatase PAP2 family protein [Candidatus Woesearchaeota archaeon]
MKLHKHLINDFFNSMTLFGMPAFYSIVLLFFMRIDFDFSIALLSALVLVEIACAAIKLAYPKSRPIPRRAKSLYERYDAGSFPSIHTARIAAVSMMVNFKYGDFMLFAVTALLTLGVAYSRIYLKEHFPVDVLGGAFLSALVSTFIWVLSGGMLGLH